MKTGMWTLHYISLCDFNLTIEYPKVPWWLSGKESACQSRRHGFNPWSAKVPHVLGQLSLCATTIEPVPRTWEPQLLSSYAAAAEALVPRAQVLQQEKPPQ